MKERIRLEGHWVHITWGAVGVLTRDARAAKPTIKWSTPSKRTRSGGDHGERDIEGSTEGVASDRVETVWHN